MNPSYVYARGGRRRGKLTGGERLCRLEGCLGRRLAVRWTDGALTWPCTGAIKIRRDGQYQIL